MRRPSKPWYRRFNDTWYVTLNGEQIPLAKGKHNRSEADRAFHRLMAAEPVARVRPMSDERVIGILDLFLEHAQPHTAPKTHAWYRGFLQEFANSFGMLRVEELKRYHVSRWLDSHASWRNRRGAISAIKRAFNWRATRS